ncbi:GNAT family N-acetyltransferase [Serratia aquatilis]|uniref:GNAT family N-acetyltransferase n=1 Tax=Serratia aquatilis TaxID=1737515 RepID=A0ABV6EC32_9GAMM
MSNIYEELKIYATANFIIRLISEDDAKSLLKCYSDINSRPLFNSDMCIGNFNFNTAEEIKSAIIAWLGCYEREEFIRFSIVDKKTNLAVGTIEMFAMVDADKVSTGVLRLDISSEYENEISLTEIITLCTEEFFDAFSVEKMVTKAIPLAKKRIASLSALGFKACNFRGNESYYSLAKKTTR